MCCKWLSCFAIDQLFCVAVICTDEHLTIDFFDCLYRFSNAFVYSFNCFDRCVFDAGMTNHIWICKVDNDHIVSFRFNRINQFDGFDRGERIKTTFVCFTEYDVTIENKQVAFVKEEITNTFGEFLAKNGKKQARIAETEKYAHVTFFFNGGVEEPNEGEDRILVKSPKVATYDLKPEMSAYEVCDKLVDAIKSETYDVIIINFANPDMVGHTVFPTHSSTASIALIAAFSTPV